MPDRIERRAKHRDANAATLLERLQREGFPVTDVKRLDNFTVDIDLSREKLESVAGMLINPIAEEAGYMGLNLFAPYESITPKSFDWAVEIGLLPGVKDREGETVEKEIKDKFKEQPKVYTSQTFFISGSLSADDVSKIADGLHNPAIKRATIKSRYEFLSSAGSIVPRVKLDAEQKADVVDLLNYDDFELQRIGSSGIFDYNRELNPEEYTRKQREYADDKLKLGDILEKDGKFFEKVRRGPLSMGLDYMQSVRDYFKERGRNPTDVELEAIAQTWSEHCKHTIFADPIDDIKTGLFDHYIKRATKKVIENKEKSGKKNFCVSVFKDNAGIIEFDENHYITDKAETHNKPSSIDPDGGSETGLGGVIRDSAGTGLGARPFQDAYLFCSGDTDDKRPLYRNQERTIKMLSPRKLLEGIVRGVNKYGNSMGIPTAQGGVCFDDRYRGNPLVFVRSVGIMPKVIAGRPSQDKGARPGDHIVLLGGRRGRDGIHGATFSSEALHSGSPAGAVQIGDPITEKNMFDALFEAQDRGLYTSITDLGAGGLSCAVGEMGRESNGCIVHLEKVPLKYSGLRFYETWISESQESMLLSVPPENWAKFKAHMDKRDVEATSIGTFTNTSYCTVTHSNETETQTIMDVSLKFLHDGLPKHQQTSKYTRPEYSEPELESLDDMTESLLSMLARKNIASYEFISRQFDHEVQGGSDLKPLQGRGMVNGDASVTRPLLESKKGVVLSQGINPLYSDLDTYDMAACAVDTAVRNAIAAGANPDHLALMDNFCWCSSKEEERLGQLKAAAQACYDFAVAYDTPFISGKDSMFNDFKGFDEDGKKINISIPPTVLISSLGVIDDSKKAVSLDAKLAGDVVYVLGETHDELGGSEYLSMVGQHGKGYVPKVDAVKNNELYRSLAKCIETELIESAQSVHRGGLAVALAKTAMGGKRGLSVSIDNLPGDWTQPHSALYSESMGRIVVTVTPEKQDRFEEMMGNNAYTPIGIITDDDKFVIGSDESELINAKVSSMLKSYKSTFEDY